MEDLPKHLAIIMDGNGRWAKKQGKPRLFGHTRGASTLRQTVDDVFSLGIQYLTVYAFSSENWSRPEEEVSGIFSLLEYYLIRESKILNDKGIRVRFIGNRKTLSGKLLGLIQEIETLTHENTTHHLTIAFGYGARDEMIRAMDIMYKDLQVGKISEPLTEELFKSYLDTRDLPDPDLMIRTSGEHRISNFLLWQLAYTEFVFLDVLWPDFSKSDLEDALLKYQNRHRRFGGL